MTETLQIILFIMLVVVIVFFLILGVQVFFLLQEVRKTVTKANKVLDDTGSITSSVSGRIASFSDIVGSVTAGTVLAKVLRVVLNTVGKSERKDRSEDEDGE